MIVGQKQIVGDPDLGNGSKTVVIGCKLPHGIALELGIGVDARGKPVAGKYTRVVLAGANGAAHGAVVAAGGYGLTRVDASFWEAWYQRNKELDFIKCGAVFCHDSEENAVAHSKDHALLLTGFERLNPDRPASGVTVDQIHLAQGKRDIAEASRVNA